MFDVITIGTATRDVFLQSDLFKIVRDPKHLQKLGFPTGEAQCFALGGKIEVSEPVLTVGGGAANTAVTFARQGLKTAAVFEIGRDQNGRDVLGHLRSERVTTYPSFDERAMTAYSVILLSPNGERTILSHRGASEDLSLRDIPFRRITSRWVYIVPGRIPLDVVLYAMKRFKASGARIAMNPSKHYLELGAKKLAPLLKMLDVVNLNREEGAYLTGERYGDEASIFKKFDKLVPGLAVLTDGPKGVLVSDGTMVYRAGIYKEKKMVDRTGAGDAFGSGFVAMLAMERSTDGKFPRSAIERAVRFGSANATSVVEYIGAQPGILRKRQFATEPRWKHFMVYTQILR